MLYFTEFQEYLLKQLINYCITVLILLGEDVG